MRRLLITLYISLICVNTIYCEIKKKEPTIDEDYSFAIVVDAATYDKIQSSIISYRDAVEDVEKLATYILIIEDEDPAGIREELKDLYNSTPRLEGAVFIGDIPIPMLRGAQHMTSAFKMDEDRDWAASSVPSDRYYDDFDLGFKFLKQDSSDSQLYYYELLPESPQKINKEIYTGRIKPPVRGEEKYGLIKEYLSKAVTTKYSPEFLDHAMVYTGHGYHSESLTSWKDEAIALREQFPQMFKIGGKLKHIRESMSSNMKEIIMMELEKKKYDMAIFHAHGSVDEQYLLSYPAAKSIQQNVESIRRFVRSKVRTAKDRGRDVEELKNYYKENYDLTEEWFEGTFVDSVYKADSITNYKMNIYSDDLVLFSPRAEFIMFDQCFNGAFQVENYIAGRYLFGSGDVITTIAGSVGVLQDLWADKSIGLLGYGMSVGNWFDQNEYLEHHILGDPTFHFEKTYSVDLNQKLREEKDNADYWRGLLTADEDEIRALAVEMLYELLGDSFIPELVKIYKTDESFNVRAHALSSLADTRSEEFEEILMTSINDPYEFLRRMTVKIMGEIGSDKYIPYMVSSLIHDESRRVAFGAGRALGQMDTEIVLEELTSYIEQLPKFVDKDVISDRFVRSINYDRNRIYEEIIPFVKNDTLELRKRLFHARMLRNQNFKVAVEPLLKVISDQNIPLEIRLIITEAFGWFNYSEKRNEIIAVMEKIIENDSLDESLKSEALKTKNRLLEGANVSLTP